jgi:hypothetical protein
MGCDIHLHIEIKISGEWHHYSAPAVRRDYELFEKMAGVRGERQNAIAFPRGLPNDATFLTTFDARHWNSDGHSHSWLSSEELILLEDWSEARNPKMNMDLDLECGILHCYLFGNSFAGLHKYPNDNRRLREMGLEDVRFVFWFDN